MKENLLFIRKNITGKFTELLPLLKQHKKAKVELKKAERRLNSFETKYKFIEDIIRIGAHDNPLATAIKGLFKSAGFTKVINYKDKRQKPKREDMQLWHGNDIFIIEIKGIKATSPTTIDTFQVLPYFMGNKKRHDTKNVYALTIINHNNKASIDQRSRTFVNEDNNRDLIASSMSLISAIDLLQHFMKLKQDVIDFDTFKNKLKKTGLLTYDSKGGKTLEK